jgi:hypothetical protein
MVIQLVCQLFAYFGGPATYLVDNQVDLHLALLARFKVGSQLRKLLSEPRVLCLSLVVVKECL